MLRKTAKAATLRKAETLTNLFNACDLSPHMKMHRKRVVDAAKMMARARTTLAQETLTLPYISALFGEAPGLDVVLMLPAHVDIEPIQREMRGHPVWHVLNIDESGWQHDPKKRALVLTKDWRESLPDWLEGAFVVPWGKQV